MAVRFGLLFVFSLSWCLYALAWAISENAFDDLLVSPQSLVNVYVDDNIQFSAVNAPAAAWDQPGGKGVCAACDSWGHKW